MLTMIHVIGLSQTMVCQTILIMKKDKLRYYKLNLYKIVDEFYVIVQVNKKQDLKCMFL